MAVSIEAYGFTETLRELREIEPRFFRQAVNDIKTDIQPVVEAVKSAIPATSPISGFEHEGRTAYRNPKKVRSRVSTRRPRGLQGANIITIRAESTAISILDMVGKSTKSPRTPQGAALIGTMNKRGKASRYVWPAVERNYPQIENSLRQTLGKISEQANKNLLVNP